MKYNYEKKIKIIIFELLSELLRSYNESTFLKVFFRGDLGVVIKIKKKIPWRVVGDIVNCGNNRLITSLTPGQKKCSPSIETPVHHTEIS